VRRYALAPLLIALTAIALIASGCGSSKSSGANGLADALSYMPKDSPIVFAFDTNPDGDQWQQVDKLIGKFPGGGQIKQQFKTAFNGRAHLDFDKDIKPLLGNDLVVSTSGQSSPGTQTPYVSAWKVKDEQAAQKLIQRNSQKAGTIQGSDYYGSGANNFALLKDGVLVIADTKEALTAALERAGSGDGMTEQDFTNALGDLDKGSLLRVVGNFQSLLSGPKGAAARKIKWVGALRSFGTTLTAEPDGISSGFHVETASGLTEKDLPLASGAQSAPVVRRAGEIGFGLRNPAQIYTFGSAVSQITNPAGYAKFARQKAKVAKQLGVNVDRDLIGQLTGNAAVSVSLDGEFALRADLRDPAAAAATLKKIAPRLKKLAKGKPVGLVAPKNGKGFYALARPNGKKVVFGVVGKSFVVATDAARAAQFAGQSPSNVPGTRGAFVIATDARSLANAAAARRGQGVAAQLITGSLGDLIGSVEAETSGITSSLKLFVK
jgi:hypothetical protein